MAAEVKEILELWFKLRDTKKEYLPVYELSHRNPWDHQIRVEMTEAFKLDPEGLTALLILDNFRDDFFSGCGLSLKDILENKNYDSFIGDCRRLTDMLSEKEIVTALAEFIGSVSGAVKGIGIDREDVTKMINDRYEMAILRRDSLRSMDVLNLHQFFQGDTAQNHLAFLPDIHLFWNMNSLIHCAWQSDDGVSINLIQDPLVTSSYFAFVAKNGGNLTILTDKPNEAHPLSKYMSRRPEKEFNRRVFRNHFPYGLMGLHYDQKGYLRPDRNGLVPLQQMPIKIGSLSTLEPDEIIWTVMMFSLLDAKLYKENYHCGELSYTSDMIADPDIGTSLIGGNQSGALMVKDYRPLVAPVLDLMDLEDDDQYKKYSGSGINNWLYERYKEQVPTGILNGLLPNDGSKPFLLGDGSVFYAPKERVREPFHSWSAEDPVLLKAPEDIKGCKSVNGVFIRWSSDTVSDAILLKKMTGDEFGSKENLMQDYRWFARYNTAKFINRKAKEEYERRKAEVTSWVKARIQQNLERISKDVIYYNLSKDTPEGHCSFYTIPMERDPWRHTVNCYKFAKDRKAYLRGPCKDSSAWLFNNVADTGCWFSEDAPCSYILKVKPYYVEDLLYLTGCSSVEELPDVLQHWKCASLPGMSDYTGNCILERVDPMDWVVKNPWEDLRFDIVIGVGKKYFSKVKRELEIEK